MNLLYLHLFLTGGKGGSGPCVERNCACLAGGTEQQRMSVKCVLFVLCARNRHDGSLIAGCGSDDATPRARLCCLCLMRSLIATPDPICVVFFWFLCFFCFFYGGGHHVIHVQSGNGLVSSTALLPSGCGRSRRHGA